MEVNGGAAICTEPNPGQAAAPKDTGDVERRQRRWSGPRASPCQRCRERLPWQHAFTGTHGQFPTRPCGRIEVYTVFRPTQLRSCQHGLDSRRRLDSGRSAWARRTSASGSARIWSRSAAPRFGCAKRKILSGTDVRHLANAERVSKPCPDFCVSAAVNSSGDSRRDHS